MPNENGQILNLPEFLTNIADKIRNKHEYPKVYIGKTPLANSGELTSGVYFNTSLGVGDVETYLRNANLTYTDFLGINVYFPLRIGNISLFVADGGKLVGASEQTLYTIYFYNNSDSSSVMIYCSPDLQAYMQENNPGILVPSGWSENIINNNNFYEISGTLNSSVGLENDKIVNLICSELEETIYKINAQEFGNEIENIKVAKEEEEKVVDVDFSLGNQVVVPSGNKVLSKITINKPATLEPRNIRENVVIGGVVGTFSTNDMLQARVDSNNSCHYLFYYYVGTNIDFIANLDTSRVTAMDYMFSRCQNVTSIPQLDTSSCTNMEDMFSRCQNVTSIPQLDTSSCTNMQNMFSSCYELTSIPQLDTSSCTNMIGLFNNCRKLTTIDITHMKIKSTYNSQYFAGFCYSLTKLIIRNMDSVPALHSTAFEDCYHFTGTVDGTYNPDGLKDGRIYVPDNIVDQVKSASNWSVYADIIVPLSTLVE